MEIDGQAEYILQQKLISFSILTGWSSWQVVGDRWNDVGIAQHFGHVHLLTPGGRVWQLYSRPGLLRGVGQRLQLSSL